jgi:hypothetical protein
VPQDRAVILGRDFLRREAGAMDGAPEAIASSGKMMPCGGRGHSGIDPAEDYGKLSGDDVWERVGHGAPPKFKQGSGRSPRGPQGPVLRRRMRTQGSHAHSILRTRSMSMAGPDMLRYKKIPLAHGSGAIPAVGFGTLIPDPLVTKQATRTALEVGFRHFDCAERYRNEEAAMRCGKLSKRE